ncbi:MAG: hypothetical protein R3E39_29980 [Anaerolineae bacterium]
MNIQVSPQTLADVLQLGGQYILPIAALLRAIYSGTRGRLPEGLGQIATAAIVAGASASVTGQQPNPQSIITDILSNTVFTAGLLTFLLLYLLRVTNLNWIIDAIVGGIIGAVIWLFTVYVLGEPWQWWMLILLVPACGVGVVLLRFALRQIVRVVRIAMVLLVVGGVLALGAGGFLVLQTLLTKTA